jgi:hypothetical protein
MLVEGGEGRERTAPLFRLQNKSALRLGSPVGMLVGAAVSFNGGLQVRFLVLPGRSYQYSIIRLYYLSPSSSFPTPPLQAE